MSGLVTPEISLQDGTLGTGNVATSARAESLDSTGLEFAAKNPRYKSSACFSLSNKNFKKTYSENIDNNVYLRGTYKNRHNVFGHNTKYTYWGRAVEEGEEYIVEANLKYISAFGDKNGSSYYSLLPLVYKNNGLIPIPNRSSNTYYPFNVNKTFTNTVYLRYDSNSDSCKYSTQESNGTWTHLNYGPGIFFIMCGAGGGGGNSSTTIAFFGTEGAGGGGGGGGSVVGYIDLRAIGRIVRVTIGAKGIGGGPTHSKYGGESGTKGGSTVLGYQQINSSASGNRISYITMLSCGGGEGGEGGDSSKSYGGAGGKNQLENNTYAKSINLIANYNGKTGGQGGGKTHDASHPGNSFVNSIKIPMPILEDSDLPSETNGVYGQGTDSYLESGDTHYGGGGGASLLSRSSGSAASGYGTGGRGGSYKNNSYWRSGANGTNGVFCVLSVN